MKDSSLKEMFDMAILLWCHRSSPEAGPSAPYYLRWWGIAMGLPAGTRWLC